ncbi:MAG: oxidoreductase FAD/NAD(P)-binding domain protein [Jatrophihabitans sp.]|nr:oxidoreductase FAD/NAD(P)-binding domain protein [Jatrophihabitans sp.]
MSLSQRIARWLFGKNTDPVGRPEDVGFRDSPGFADKAASPASEPRPRPAPADNNSTLVVGSAEHRLPEPELPAFYQPAVVQPQPRPYDAPGLLTRHLSYDREDLQEAWALVSDRADTFVSTFYAELFVRLPDAMFMFPSQMSRQRQDFGKALIQWVLADDPEAMTIHLQQLGADHRKFDVEPRQYEVAGAALVSTWKTLAGPQWRPRYEAAVLGSYTRLASVMIDGAMRSLSEPASWSARVVEHHRVLQDFAVVRIQPDAPYAFRPGQYLTVELATRAKEWRQMSIASAPRADNTFDIHVRSVGATGVSAALVMHTRVGDRLRLGPPRGNDLVVEPGTVPGGLLCVSSGTGAAPISAVVESILDWPDQRPVYAFVGGRNRDDIYPVGQLNQLIQARARMEAVQVFGVVSDDPSYAGYRGRVETVVPPLANWAGLGVEVLVAGPDPMIAATVQNLTEAGVPADKIHFDQYEVAA